jgi:hypothetical protein
LEATSWIAWGGRLAALLFGAQYEDFHEAQPGAFTELRLTEAPRFRLETPLPGIATGGDFRAMVSIGSLSIAIATLPRVRGLAVVLGDHSIPIAT